MKVKNYQKHQDDETCMRMEKECKCTYYCCNRQEMHCYYTEGGSEKNLGKCFDPWDLCNYRFKIYSDDVSGKDCDYVIQAKCCQLYFFCQCPCESCQTVNFDIHQGDSNTPDSVVGKLVKKGRDCMKNAVMGDDGTMFSVDFPKGSNWRQRAMLMNVTVFIDYVMFEDSSKDSAGGDQAFN